MLTLVDIRISSESIKHLGGERKARFGGCG